MPPEATLGATPAAARTLRPLPRPGWLRGLSLAFSRGLAMVSQVGVQLVVGALSGRVGLGILQLFTAWTNVLGEAAARGHPLQLLRRASVAWRDGNADSVRRAVDHAARSVLRGVAPCLAVAVGVLLLASFVGLPEPVGDRSALAIALVLAAGGFALLRLLAEVLKAMDAPLTAVTRENLVAPLVMLLFYGGAHALGHRLDTAVIASGFLVGLGVAVLSLLRAYRSRLTRGGSPDCKLTAASDPGGDPASRRERHALWAGSLLAVAFLQLPFLVMPAFTDTGTIGVYAVAHKLVNVVTTLLLLLSSVFGPAFARAAEDRNTDALRRALRRTQALSLGLFLPAAFLLLATSSWLGALFNVPSSSLVAFLVVLMIGQTVNAATGLAGVLLSVSGAPGAELRATTIAGVAGLVLAAPIGMACGAMGLAWLFTAVIAFKNLLSFAAARRWLSQLENRS